MNKEVSFELAKSLKEAGFNEHCSNIYAYGRENTIIENLAKIDNNNGCGYWLAPTIAEVVMWIYEEYSVWIVVNITISSDWYFELYDLNSKRNAEIKVDANLYNSPTKAYEAAIKYCFTQIIKP